MNEMLKILTIDDEPSITEIVTEFLDLFLTVEISSSNNSVEAIELLKTQVFDLVITDHFMPEYSGVDVVKSIRKSDCVNFKTPIFVLTSLHSEVEKEINGMYENVKVLDKVSNLHLLGGIVAELFPKFKNPLAD